MNMACVMDMDIERFIRYEEEEEERKAFIEKYDTDPDAVSELEHYERHMDLQMQEWEAMRGGGGARTTAFSRAAWILARLVGVRYRLCDLCIGS